MKGRGDGENWENWFATVHGVEDTPGEGRAAQKRKMQELKF